jgi:transposase-like protein
LVKKRQRRLEGFDAKGLARYARGLSTREMQEHWEEWYGVEGAPTLIANVTAAVLDEVRTWQARPLASLYPLLYGDAWCGKSRHEGPVHTTAVYVALGVTGEREKEWLGLGRSETEGATCWFFVFTDLNSRGVEDCFIAGVDGLQGLPEALEAGCPPTPVQLGIVHKVRNSRKYVPWKERTAVAAALRAVSGAAPWAEAEHAWERLAERWGTNYPTSSPSWRADGDRLTVLVDYPPALRRVS